MGQSIGKPMDQKLGRQKLSFSCDRGKQYLIQGCCSNADTPQYSNVSATMAINNGQYPQLTDQGARTIKKVLSKVFKELQGNSEKYYGVSYNNLPSSCSSLMMNCSRECSLLPKNAAISLREEITNCTNLLLQHASPSCHKNVKAKLILR